MSAPASTPTASTFSFGGPSTTSAPGFGSSGLLFGSNSNAPATTPTSNSFSFGVASTAPAITTTPASNPFSFGMTSTAPATTTTPASNPFSFGVTSTAPASTTTPASNPFSFSSNAPNTTTTSSFLNTSNASNTFGSTNNSNPTFSFGTGTNGFGTGTTGFGTGTTGFGTGTTGFGTGTTGFGIGTTGFGTGTSGSGNLSSLSDQQRLQRDQKIYELLTQADQEARKAAQPSITSEDYKPDNVWQALALLKSWWDPKSANCKFQHYFYNIVEKNDVARYVKPEGHDQAAWDAAQVANPDPTTMVPALAIGFDSVQKRMDWQRKLSEAHSEKLRELEETIRKIQKNRMIETATKLQEYKRKHMEASQRVIKFLKYAQVLRNKGLSITPDEEVMRARLENIQDQLMRSEQFHGKLSQLWAQLQLIKESGRKYGKIDGVDEWDAVSDENMAGLTKILEEQDNGVQHIIEVLNTDAKEIEMVDKAWRANQQRYY